MGEHEENRKAVVEAAVLRSLGIVPKEGVYDKEEMKELANIIKESYYQGYKLAYSKKGAHYEEEAKSTITL